MPTRDDSQTNAHGDVRQVGGAEISSEVYRGKATATVAGIVSHIDAAREMSGAGVKHKSDSGGQATRKTAAEAARRTKEGKKAVRASQAKRSAAAGAFALARAQKDKVDGSVRDDDADEVASGDSGGSAALYGVVRHVGAKKLNDRAALKASAKRDAAQASSARTPGSGSRKVRQTAKGKSRGYKTSANAKRINKSTKATARVMRLHAPASIASAVASAVSHIGAAAASFAASASALLTPAIIGVAFCSVLAITFLGVGAAVAASQHNMSSLSDVERQIASYLYAKGFNDAQVAGVLGNAMAESGMNPACEENLSGMWNAYEVNCGLFCYTSCTPGGEEYWAFKNWCSSTGRAWEDVLSQMIWTFDEDGGGYWKGRWTDRRNYYRSACASHFPQGSSMSHEVAAFEQTEDPSEAAYLWMACYEGPAGGDAAHLDRRIAYAQMYYARLTSGIGGGSKQAVVAEAMKHLGKPYIWGASGPDAFDCSGFTAWCYRVALGIDLDHYDLSQKALGTEIPISEAVEGDLLWKPGHIGIYMGGGKSIEAKGAAYGVCIDDANRYTCAVRIL